MTFLRIISFLLILQKNSILIDSEYHLLLQTVLAHHQPHTVCILRFPDVFPQSHIVGTIINPLIITIRFTCLKKNFYTDFECFVDGRRNELNVTEHRAKASVNRRWTRIKSPLWITNEIKSLSFRRVLYVE